MEDHYTTNQAATYKINVVAPEATVRLSPALSCSTRPLAVRPLMVPPTVTAPVTQVILTLVTLAAATVPEPPVTVQVCAGLVGCAETVTAYALPDCTAVANVNVVAPALTARVSPPLSCSIKPLPLSPLIEPPIV